MNADAIPYAARYLSSPSVVIQHESISALMKLAAVLEPRVFVGKMIETAEKRRGETRAEIYRFLLDKIAGSPFGSVESPNLSDHQVGGIRTWLSENRYRLRWDSNIEKFVRTVAYNED